MVCIQVEFMSAKALAQDMYIEELERNIGDAARMMLDDGGCHRDHQSQQLTAWLNATATRASYSHLRRHHIEVFSWRFYFYRTMHYSA